MRYSSKFNEKFYVFLKLWRTDLITFCGSIVMPAGDPSAKTAKEIFMLFENGEYRDSSQLLTRHPNIVKAVITAKMGWGLWVKEWSSGIACGLFSRQEILNEFEIRGIKIPEAFLKEFDNAIRKKKYA